MKYFYIFITSIIITSVFTLSSCENNNNTNLKTIETAKPIEEDILPETKYGIEIDNYNITSEQIKPNQFFSDIINEYNIAYDIVLRASQFDTIFNVANSIRVGNKISYFTNKTDSVKKLEYIVYEKDIKNYVVFDLRDSLNVYLGKKESDIRLRKVSGQINSSLWNAMTDINVSPILAIELSEVYAWSIDFFGLQKGDHFSIIFQEEYIDSSFYKIDTIHAIRFDHSNHYFYAFRYQQDSTWNFFDEEGNSLRKAFLKAPLRYSRISSKYSNSRFHPVLKIRRPHHGVDYAAPKGTPIHSIGDGRVKFIGRKGGYGRRVEIKHNSVYTTGYAHLSKYAKGLKKGDFVKQGQIIGYVGMSGTATGPHLDFRVYKNGSPINPLKMKSPPIEPIKKENLEAYKQAIGKYQNSLDSLINIIHNDTINNQQK